MSCKLGKYLMMMMMVVSVMRFWARPSDPSDIYILISDSLKYR